MVQKCTVCSDYIPRGLRKTNCNNDFTAKSVSNSPWFCKSQKLIWRIANNSEKIFTSTSNNTTCTDVQNDSSTRSSTISCDAPVKRPREVDQDSDEMDLPPTK